MRSVTERPSLPRVRATTPACRRPKLALTGPPHRSWVDTDGPSGPVLVLPDVAVARQPDDEPARLPGTSPERRYFVKTSISMSDSLKCFSGDGSPPRSSSRLSVRPAESPATRLAYR